MLFISSNNESIHNQGQFKSYIALTHSGQSGQILIKKEILINFDKKSEFWQKNRNFWQKLEILTKKSKVWQKSKFWQEMEFR